MDQKKTITLMDIIAQSNIVEGWLTESGGEVTPELDQFLAEIDTQLETKAEAYSVIMARLERAAEVWQDRADAYSRLAKSLTSTRTRMKDRIKAALQAMGKADVAAGNVKFKLSRSAPALDLYAPEQLPARFFRVTQVQDIDKEAIKTALKAGEEIPGARLRDVVVLRESINK